MKMIIKYAAAGCLLMLIGVANAGDWTGAGLTISVAAPTPTADPTPAPIAPVPPSGITTADPNANAAARSVLAYLYSLESAGATHHMVQSSQDVIRNCSDAAGADNCAAEDSENYSAAGNQYYGAVGVDYCNAAWGDPSTAPCVFGSSSETNTQAKTWWAAGSLVIAHMDPPNPAVNWQNIPASNFSAIAKVGCAGDGGTATLVGPSYDCSGGMSDAFVQTMLTCPQSYCMHSGTQTAQNADWNSLLNQYVAGFQDLQNSGVAAIFAPYQENDATSVWWGPNLAPGTMVALWIYTQKYFEAAGIHNLLYAFVTIDGGEQNYPGNQYVDITGFDNYNQYGGGGYVDPRYTAALNAGGGNNKPQVWPEYNASQYSSYGYDAYDQAAEYGPMPNLVLINLWSEVNPGTADGNPYWQGFMQDPYNVMRQTLPAGF
jgi:hypothetical protein